MVWPVFLILLSILVFLDTTEESLLSRFEVLDDSKRGSREDNLVIVLAEVADGFVSVTRETIHMIDLILDLWLRTVELNVFRCLTHK